MRIETPIPRKNRKVCREERSLKKVIKSVNIERSFSE